jgi:hypothetical protein
VQLDGPAAVVGAAQSGADSERGVGLAAQVEDLGAVVLGYLGQIVDVVLAPVQFVRLAGVGGVTEISGFVAYRAGRWWPNRYAGGPIEIVREGCGDHGRAFRGAGGQHR